MSPRGLRGEADEWIACCLRVVEDRGPGHPFNEGTLRTCGEDQNVDTRRALAVLLRLRRVLADANDFELKRVAGTQRRDDRDVLRVCLGRDSERADPGILPRDGTGGPIASAVAFCLYRKALTQSIGDDAQRPSIRRRRCASTCGLLRLEECADTRPIEGRHRGAVAFSRRFRRLPVLNELSVYSVVPQRSATGCREVDRILGRRAVTRNGRQGEGQHGGDAGALGSSDGLEDFKLEWHGLSAPLIVFNIPVIGRVPPGGVWRLLGIPTGW